MCSAARANMYMPLEDNDNVAHAGGGGGTNMWRCRRQYNLIIDDWSPFARSVRFGRTSHTFQLFLFVRFVLALIKNANEWVNIQSAQQTLDGDDDRSMRPCTKVRLYTTKVFRKWKPNHNERRPNDVPSFAVHRISDPNGIFTVPSVTKRWCVILHNRHIKSRHACIHACFYTNTPHIAYICVCMILCIYNRSRFALLPHTLTLHVNNMRNPSQITNTTNVLRPDVLSRRLCVCNMFSVWILDLLLETPVYTAHGIVIRQQHAWIEALVVCIYLYSIHITF